MKTVNGSSPNDVRIIPIQENGETQGTGPPAEVTGPPAEGASYGLNFHTNDAWFFTWIKELGERERLLMTFRFVRDHKSQEVEHFTLLAMPESFITAYEEKRSYTVKEAFRRAMRKLFGETKTIDNIPLLDTVISHIKASGSFRLDDLPDILGRAPNPHEVEQVRIYLASLSNEDLKLLLHSNSLGKATRSNTQ